MRLDAYLSQKFANFSRQKAQEAIQQGRVLINGKIIKKCAFLVGENDSVELNSSQLLLGRAGYKLRGFLQELKTQNILDSLINFHALDVGSSVGGFTQVLLESGVDSIVCVDVGSNQLHISLRENPRVNLYENCDFRAFRTNEAFDLCVCDVSFISLNALLAHFGALNCKRFIWLFKPQFEVGIAPKRDKKGVIKDKNLGAFALNQFCENLTQNGFTPLYSAKSSLKGKEGNEEYFIYGTK